MENFSHICSLWELDCGKYNEQCREIFSCYPQNRGKSFFVWVGKQILRICWKRTFPRNNQLFQCYCRLSSPDREYKLNFLRFCHVNLLLLCSQHVIPFLLPVSTKVRIVTYWHLFVCGAVETVVPCDHRS